jgi:hypothetical protein
MTTNLLNLLDEDRLIKAIEVARILNISRALAYQLMTRIPHLTNRENRNYGLVSQTSE